MNSVNINGTKRYFIIIKFKINYICVYKYIYIYILNEFK